MNLKGGIFVECLDRFNAKMRRTGFSIRDDKIKSSKMILDQTFYDDASYQSGIYFWRLGLLEIGDYEKETSIDIRLYKRIFSNANGWTVKFQTLHDTPVEVGDIIFDSKSQEYFICTESFNIDDVHYQGKFTLCNWILKWQDEKLNVFQYPCFVINVTQYNSGEQSTKQYTIGSSQHMIKLPCDENTVKLKTPQKFMLDKNYDNPVTYIVTQNDTITFNYGSKGIVVITVLEEPIDRAKDRIDLGICNYIEPDNTTDNSGNETNGKISTGGNEIDETETINIKSVIKYTSKVIKSGGNAKTFTAKFYDDNDNEVEVVPKWNIVCAFKDKLVTNITGDKIKISIDDDSCVDEDFRLVLSDSEGNYESSLIISIKSLL